MLFSPQIHARSQQRQTVTGGAYVGPGDVVSSAYAWYGLRGYTAAYSTGSNPALDLVDQAGANQITVNILSNGRLDVSAISAWVTANSVSTIKVKRMYDQTGGGRHLDQATLTNMPVLNLTGFGTFPAVVFTAASSHSLVAGTSSTLSQPNTFSFVYLRPSGGSTFQEAFSFQSGATIFMKSGGGENTFYLQTGGTGSADVTASAGSWHAAQAVFNTTSSAAYVDGSSTTGLNAGSTNISGQTFRIAAPSVANYWGGSVAEIGVWNSAFNSTQAGNMNTNQHGSNGYSF